MKDCTNLVNDFRYYIIRSLGTFFFLFVNVIDKDCHFSPTLMASTVQSVFIKTNASLTNLTLYCEKLDTKRD